MSNDNDSESDIDYDSIFNDDSDELSKRKLELAQESGFKVPEELQEKNNGLQKVLIKEGMIRKEKSDNLLDEILKEVGNYLQSNPNIKYKVIGGKAVSAWLNPDNKKLNQQELDHVKTIDWDLVVIGDNNDSRELAINIHEHIRKKFGTTLEIRKDNTMTFKPNSNVYVYQVGIPDSKKIEWIVDVHAENKKEFDMNNTVMFNNIRYPNLKNLIKSIEIAMKDDLLKLLKRTVRKNLLKKAMEDIFRFNKYVSNEICKQCIDNKYEKITGYNLNCYKIIKLCPQFDFKQQISDKLLDMLRKKRIQTLIN